MKTKDKLHSALDCEEEAEMVIWDFGFRWFMFGFGAGAVVTMLIMHYLMKGLR